LRARNHLIALAQRHAPRCLSSSLQFGETHFQSGYWLKAEPQERSYAVIVIRVLIVDDYAPWRRFIATSLASKQEIALVDEAKDGLTGIQKAMELQPDLVVLDMSLPDLSGIEIARKIRESVPKAKILFLTENSSQDIVRKALSTGAEGYVVKSRAARDLIPAVENLLLGKTFISSSVGGNSSFFNPLCMTLIFN